MECESRIIRHSRCTTVRSSVNLTWYQWAFRRQQLHFMQQRQWISTNLLWKWNSTRIWRRSYFRKCYFWIWILLWSKARYNGIQLWNIPLFCCWRWIPSEFVSKMLWICCSPGSLSRYQLKLITSTVQCLILRVSVLILPPLIAQAMNILRSIFLTLFPPVKRLSQLTLHSRLVPQALQLILWRWAASLSFSRYLQ